MSDATEAACGHHATRLLDKANVVGVAGGDDHQRRLDRLEEPDTGDER